MLDRYTGKAASAADRPSDPDARPGRAKRRGVTAMEYCVMASFVLAVVVLAVQHIGSLVSPSFNKASKGTNAPTAPSSTGSGSTGRQSSVGSTDATGSNSSSASASTGPLSNSGKHPGGKRGHEKGHGARR